MRYGALILLGGMVALLYGCGGATQNLASTGGQSAPHISGQAFAQDLAAAPEATATEIDYRGWKALQLSNGLVTVIAVPAAGGRILSYQLGKLEYLYSDPSLTAKSPGAPDYGGDRMAPVSPDKAALDAAAPGLNGKWIGSITTARGILAEIQMTSPDDKGTGLRLTRTVRLYAGGTHLQVSDTLQNLGEKPVKWSVGSATQALSVAGSKSPQGEVQAFLPAVSTTQHAEGFWSLGGAKDLATLLKGSDKLVQVAYRGQAGQVAVRDAAGWLALTNAVEQNALVRRFPANDLNEYPGDASAEVVATEYAAGKAGGLTLISRGPLQEVAPGKDLTFAQDWYATMATGPITGATEIAALSKPLTLQPQGTKLRLQGQLGVFAAGNLVITLLDASGQPVGTSITVPARPDQAVVVDQTLPGGTAASVKLAMETDRGTPLGEIASLSTAPQ